MHIILLKSRNETAQIYFFNYWLTFSWMKSYAFVQLLKMFLLSMNMHFIWWTKVCMPLKIGTFAPTLPTGGDAHLHHAQLSISACAVAPPCLAVNYWKYIVIELGSGADNGASYLLAPRAATPFLFENSRLRRCDAEFYSAPQAQDNNLQRPPPPPHLW